MLARLRVSGSRALEAVHHAAQLDGGGAVLGLQALELLDQHQGPIPIDWGSLTGREHGQ